MKKHFALSLTRSPTLSLRSPLSGLDLLVSVYRDLVELPMDQSKYRSWASKSLPENLRPAAHILSDLDRGGNRKRERERGRNEGKGIIITFTV